MAIVVPNTVGVSVDKIAQWKVSKHTIRQLNLRSLLVILNVPYFLYIDINTVDYIGGKSIMRTL